MLLRTFFLVGISALMVVISACSETEKIPTSINQVKVALYESETIRTASKIARINENDSVIVNRFTIVQPEGDRTFDLQPPVSSNSAMISQISFRNGSAFARITTRGSSLSIIDNSRECSERGFLGLFCKSWYQRSNYTTLNANGNEYKIRGWDGSSTQESISEAIIVFDNVPPDSISQFKIQGLGWETGVVTLGVSREENDAITRFKQELQSASGSLTFRGHALLMNRQIGSSHATQILYDELLNKIQTTNDPLIYSTVIDNLSDNSIKASSRSKELGVGFVDAIYKTSIRGSNDTILISNFLATDGSQLPPEKFDNVFKQGVALESKKIETIVEQIDSINSLTQILMRIKGQGTVNDRKERFFRSVYATALEEKRNNRVVRSMMVYKALLEAPAAVGSTALFDLQRDQEMREFLTSQFEKLRAQSAENSQRISSDIRTMSNQLNSAMRAVADNTSRIVDNTVATQESRTEEQARNLRMTRDMFFENRYLERAHGR